ncbi:MAG TPA: hypothetical protein VKF32_15860 [Thermoanaerobaculia bacterium]|nr:hypothetical protein [Thermoanaerobaculia bacterium]
MRRLVLALLLVSAAPAFAQEWSIEFEPKVGAAGAQVRLKTPPPPGADIRFGGRRLSAARDARGQAVFVVPPGVSTSFIEYVREGKVVGKSAVPFVVSGTSLVGTAKLVGLKEAIDVFGYSEPRPEGGEKPETPARAILSLGQDEILTLGELPPARFQPALDLGDAASAATRGMGPPGLLLTARPPKKKVPTPVPTPAP